MSHDACPKCGWMMVRTSRVDRTTGRNELWKVCPKCGHELNRTREHDVTKLQVRSGKKHRPNASMTREEKIAEYDRLYGNKGEKR